jgi:hypothetical protein
MARFGVKEVADVIFYDLMTGKPALFLDSLKMSNLENNAETSYIQGGKGNARILGFDYNRTATFTLQDALMNPKALAMQAGAEVKKGIVHAHKREVLDAVASATTGSTEVSLLEAPVAGSVTVFTTEDGYDHNEEVVPTALAQAMTFSDVDVPAGSKVVVYYQYETTENAEQIIISSDKYAGFYKVVGQTVIRNAKTNQDEAFEIEVPKAKIMSNWTLNMSPEGEPAVFDMALDVFKDTENTDMVKLTRIG